MSMTDDASLARPFLDTIRAAMARDDADAGPWLVYADWLEERGECNMAELIRTACELETLGPGRPVIKCTSITVESRKSMASVTAHTARVESWINTIFGDADKRELVIHATAYRDMIRNRTDLPPTGSIVRLVTRNTMSPEPAYELDAVIEYELDAVIESFEVANGRVSMTATLAEPDPHAARQDEAMRRVGELERVVERSTLFFRGLSPTLTWRRGLIIELSAEWRAWLAHGDAITRRHPVVAVQFTGGAMRFTSSEFNAAELKGRWPGVAFSWRHATADDFRRITGDRLYEAMREQPVRPGDTLYWLPMQGEERGGEGGPTG